METFINQINEKKLPKQVTEMLMAETEKKNINCVWLQQQEHQACSLLTVMGKNKSLLEPDFDKNFIQDTLKNDQVLISILDEADLKQHSEDGYLFFNRYAKAKDQIYGEEKNGIRYWFFEHDLKKIRNRYLAGESLLTKYAEELAEGDIPGATVLYLKNIQHDLEFLEYLRFGRPFEDFDLPERLRHMEAFIPEVRKFFVKEDGHYYILRQIENEEMTEYMDDHQDLISKVKNQMKRIVLRNMQAKQPKNNLLKPPVSHSLLKNQPIKKVLRPLLHMAHLEEVYLFHEITSIHAGLNLTHYYLLAVVSQEKVKEAAGVFHKINEELPAHIKFTIIYHTRLWIQENTYQSQHFLKNIMNTDQKIFTNGFHPKIHWDRDDTFSCDDSVIYHRRAKTIYKRHLKEVLRNEKSAMVSIIPFDLNEYLVQILINSLYDTVDYLPEIKDVEVLWDILLYAHPKGTQLEDQLQKLSFDLIGYLSKHRKVKLPALHIDQEEKKLLFDLIKRIKGI